MHWNLIRVHCGTFKAIEVFEPMGKPGEPEWEHWLRPSIDCPSFALTPVRYCYVI